VAYSFQGVEVIAVTAFEARDASALRWPSRWIAYVVFLLYFLCTIGEALNVKWSDPHLPLIYGDPVAKNSTMNMNPPTTSVIIFTTFLAGYQSLAGFLNGCLIFSNLSAANTSLYVSSRTLYGITREMPDTNWLNKQIRRLSLVVPRTGVPAAALLFSAVSFFWLPFLQLKGGYALQDLIDIISVSASIACLIVWSALCLAFIRYHWW
jgi:amino acid transporter